MNGRSERWRARRQSEMVQNFAGRLGRMDGGDDFQSSAAALAQKHVDLKHSFHQLRPSVISFA